MLEDAGRFEAADRGTAERVVSWALDAPDGDERWTNLQLEVDDEHYEEDSVLFSIVAARGPSVPLATITGPVGGRRPAPAAVGIEHRAGTKAIVQLREAGVEPSGEWRVVQDHPRRGLVLELPDATNGADVATWLVDAMVVLNRAPVLSGVNYESHRA